MVSASKAQKQTLNVPYCLNWSAHSIFFFQILDIIHVAEADDVPWQTSYFNKLCFQKKKFCFKILVAQETWDTPVSSNTGGGTGLLDRVC